jgi:hypothetical protein
VKKINFCGIRQKTRKKPQIPLFRVEKWTFTKSENIPWDSTREIRFLIPSDLNTINTVVNPFLSEFPKKYRKINEKRHFLSKRLALLTLIFLIARSVP